jgi:hypothetical protein
MTMSSIPNSVQGVGLPSSMVRFICSIVVHSTHLTEHYS